MSHRQRLRPVVLVAAAAAFVLSGCGQQHDAAPTRLDADQAQALGVMRFNNYSAHHLDVRMSLDTGTVDLRASAVLDLRKGAGYAEYSTTSSDSGSALNTGMLAWNDQLIETAEGGDFADPPGSKKWTERSLTSTSVTDLLLVLALELGSDRPENPALLQQGGSRLLRTEGSGADTTYVISGPGGSAADTGTTSDSNTSKTTYWVSKTGHLSKFTADLGGRLATIEVVGPTGFPKRIPSTVLRYLRMKG